MTIASEIERINTAKDNIKTAIESKGVEVPSSTKLDGYASLIESIDSGGGDIKGLFKQVNPTEMVLSGSWNGSPDPSVGASNCNYITYEDSDYWVYIYVYDPWVYNTNCTGGDHCANVDSIIWIVDKNNNYTTSKLNGGHKTVYYGTSSDKNFWGYDCFWGTKYLYKNGNQLKFQSYNNYASKNSTYSFNMVAYGLYDLTIDLSTKTVTNSQIYSQTKSSSYTESGPTLPDSYLYENLSYHPDDSWTLLGNPSGNSMNQGYHGYSVAPSYNGSRDGTCYWSGIVSLTFTA